MDTTSQSAEQTTMTPSQFTLIPRSQWIEIKRPELKTKTDGGLYLPEGAVNRLQQLANYGEIVQLGEDVTPDRYQVGMLVVFSAAGGYTVKILGQEVFYILESDIIATSASTLKQKEECTICGAQMPQNKISS
jgi:co-chaperonin GroES (HSP10)